MLDIALAPTDPEHAWLTFPQARALFGARATDEQRRTAHERRARAGALAVASMLAGAVVALGLVLAGAVTAVAVGWALPLCSAVLGDRGSTSNVPSGVHAAGHKQSADRHAR